MSVHSSKREALKRLMGQTKLMEIIDRSYDSAKDCSNCKDLSEWWEEFGTEISGPEVMPSVKSQRRR